MDRDRTKQEFAEALEAMMGETPLEKVRVSKLCERVGVQRALFYYHFCDKYDLVAWIFIRDLRLSMGKGDAETNLRNVMATALTRMWSRREFYRRAFEDRGQNSIESYIHRFDVELGTETVLRATGAESLTPRQQFLIKSSSYGSIFCVVEWLKGQLEASPEDFAAWVIEGMPAFLREAYEMAFSGAEVRYRR